MITLFCIHPHGFNIGNDAIHVALRQMLFTGFGQVVNVISLPATSRFESHAQGGLSAKTIHEINQYGDGVIVGGGNLYENGQLDVNLDALHALEPPLMLFSLSRGRTYNRRGELVDRTDVMPDRVIRGLHGRADLSLARDEATLAHLHAIGCDRAVLGGCPTITLADMAERLPPMAASDRGGVLVSIRHPSLMNIPLDRQARVGREMEELVARLQARFGPRVRLLCHDHRDLPFAATIRGVEYVYTDDVYSYLALLRACDLNVTFRLHSALPCMAFGRPFVKVSYDERGTSAMSTFGMDAWNIELMGGDWLAAVDERLGRLTELPAHAERALPRWRTLRGAMTGAITTFRGLVERYRATGRRVEAA